MTLAIHGGVVPTKNLSKRQEARMDLAAALSIDGKVKLVGVADLERLEMGMEITNEDRFFLPGIVAIATVAAMTSNSLSAPGQQHWLLEDVVVLEQPIAHQGAQDLWMIEPGALAQIEAQTGRNWA